MTRIEESLELTADERSTLQEGDAAHEALLALLAYMASSDGQVHPQELDFLERVLPGRTRDDLSSWAMGLVRRPVSTPRMRSARTSLAKTPSGTPQPYYRTACCSTAA